MECRPVAADDGSEQVRAFALPISPVRFEWRVREQSSVGSVECLRTAHPVVRLASVPLVCRTDVRAAASRQQQRCFPLMPGTCNRYLAQCATMVLARIVVDNTMGVFEMLDSEQSMGRLRKRELAPLTPYVKGIENKHKVSASCAGVTCLAMG